MNAFYVSTELSISDVYLFLKKAICDKDSKKLCVRIFPFISSPSERPFLILDSGPV